MEQLSKILLSARAACTAGEFPTADGVFESVALSVQEHMAGFDASHDFNHVIRVAALSQYIMATERRSTPQHAANPAIVLLAAVVFFGGFLTSPHSLLHDVTDKKYIKDPDPGSRLTQILAKAGVDEHFATAVVAIVNNVSYSTEIRDPGHTQSVLKMYPELGIVQDADRLDAIGAIGVGRAFTFGGAKMPLSDMQLSRDHMTEKLEKLESMMKTDTGKRLATERTQRIHTFSKWWDQETRLFDVLPTI
ncbi:hypothetical protein LLEC1_01467 [Akanthomyces lecanii]|uniref:HD domain-containing protein n=1 Tax=Cordyceps confragosa TaxID=2714763 RepID=A0A179I190_CORDF|nr:hypothetical protein LLEC1_01467 [Akanthomyces lecanii]